MRVFWLAARSSALAVAIANFAVTAPAFAGEPAGDATAIVNAIYKGDDLSPLLSGMKLQGAEVAELQTLKGCRPALGAGSSQAHVFLTYACDDVKSTAAPGGYTLEMIFAKATLVELWLNPEGALSPSAAQVAQGKLPSRSTITKDFVAALRDGSDATLGGIVTVSPSQSRRIAAYKGCTPRFLATSHSDRSVYRWSCQGQSSADETISELHFDKKGRPVGLSFAKLLTVPNG